MEIDQHPHHGKNSIFLPYLTCSVCEKNSLKNDKMVIKYKRCVHCGGKLIDKKSMKFIEKLNRIKKILEDKNGND